ncbi:MAG TPA: succinate dehydrogenase, cytochrome b556 subunit [Vicinamibacterales bacterium]
MLLRYRGGEGMLAWAFHRISGVAIWLFLVLHIVDIFLVGAAPDVYDTLLGFYATPVGIIMEWLLGAAVLYHALNGLRIVIMDFWPPMAHYHRQLWYASWAVFFAVGLPVTYVIFGQFSRAMGWSA